MNRKLIVACMVGATALAACGPPHVRPFTPRHRNYKAGKYAATQADLKPVDGSLFSEAYGGLLSDTRAVRAGDVLVVKIEEDTNAAGNATTKLTRSSKRDDQVQAVLGLVPALKKSHPDIDPAKLLSWMTNSDFAGDGQTKRTGTLKGNIAVRVCEVMPNGDLFVEGTKVVMINNEENHLYISGLVRTSDIGRDNTVSSSRIADAQVEFTGRGDVADQIDRGWLAKIFDAINPF
ncbi:MAG: flagellar basal body L-ring protein FlgH [Deltaproteobacteria bacterium]|nr:flagellar basal body L-ring protein FlgH [Deltaproteobacteria bacterium]